MRPPPARQGAPPLGPLHEIGTRRRMAVVPASVGEESWRVDCGQWRIYGSLGLRPSTLCGQAPPDALNPPDRPASAGGLGQGLAPLAIPQSGGRRGGGAGPAGRLNPAGAPCGPRPSASGLTRPPGPAWAWHDRWRDPLRNEAPAENEGPSCRSASPIIFFRTAKRLRQGRRWDGPLWVGAAM